MPQDIPRDLETDRNRPVLRHIEGLSAHSDIVDALAAALRPLGDVQRFCPDPQACGYELASTRGVIFAVALGMNTIGFRLDERMKGRALASGGAPFPECGPEWVSFTLFRGDWPRIDLEFWARKAYVAVREFEA
jgi:hypothetical protein